MAHFFDELNDQMKDFISNQQMFFVSIAPKVVKK